MAEAIVRPVAPVTETAQRSLPQQAVYDDPDCTLRLMKSFLGKIEPEDENGCVIWKGALNEVGQPIMYIRPTLRHKPVSIGARRWIHQFCKGKITGHNNIVPICRDELCVSVKHTLELTHSAMKMRAVEFRRDTNTTTEYWWSEQDDKQLKYMYEHDCSTEEIAKSLGRSASGIKGRIARTGIGFKKPIRSTDGRLKANRKNYSD